MSRKNVEVAERFMEAWNARDADALAEATHPEGVASLFADDAELADAGGLGVAGAAAGVRYGPEGFLRANEEALEAFEDDRVEAEEFIDAGETVVVPVRISGRGRASGAELETHLAHVWVFRNGKVIRGEVYWSTEEALEAVGLSE